MTKPKDRWKARKLKGGIYCAPACGGRCTQRAHDLAWRRAKALVKKLGKGWVTRVHENLGWHYSAVSACGSLLVYEHEDRNGKAIDCTAFLNEPERQPGGRWVGRGDTAKKAVADAIRQARSERDTIDCILAAVGA